MAHRLAARAELDLEEIWLYLARESGSHEVADRLIDSILDRFLTLANFPLLGRSREQDFGPGYRSLTAGEYVIVYAVEDGDAVILRVVHGRRDLEPLFGN